MPEFSLRFCSLKQHRVLLPPLPGQKCSQYNSLPLHVRPHFVCSSRVCLYSVILLQSWAVSKSINNNPEYKSIFKCQCFFLFDFGVCDIKTGKLKIFSNKTSLKSCKHEINTLAWPWLVLSYFEQHGPNHAGEKCLPIQQHFMLHQCLNPHLSVWTLIPFTPLLRNSLAM